MFAPLPSMYAGLLSSRSADAPSPSPAPPLDAADRDQLRDLFGECVACEAPLGFEHWHTGEPGQVVWIGAVAARFCDHRCRTAYLEKEAG